MTQKKQHFYHSLISIESIEIELEKFSLTPGQKDELAELAEKTLHHAILDLVLSELSDEDKHLFLAHHAADNHKEVWNILTHKIDNIEEKIKTTAGQVSKKLHQDLTETVK